MIAASFLVRILANIGRFSQILARLNMVEMLGVGTGGMMKKFVVVTALAAVLLQHPVSTAVAKDVCYSPAAIEAEEALRFITDLMVASTACRDQTYGLFQQRNRDAIVAYQKAMIAHFHGNAAFDKWHTSLANEASLKTAGMSSTQVCQQAADNMKKAASLDVKGLRAFAAAAAASAAPRYNKCRR